MVRSEADERYKRCVLELERFGDRLSASPREHAAAEYLVEQLRAAGLEVEKQAFRGASSHGARFLVHVLLACAGIAAGWRWPLAGAALAAAALASLVAEQMTYGVWLSRLVCRSRSYNVVGRLRPSGRPVRRVIVSAHYDTQRRGWIWAPARVLVPLQARLPPTLMQPFLLLNLLMLLQVAAGVLAAFVPGLAALRYPVVVLWCGYGIFIVLLGQWAFAPAVPGGADNGSGVAAAIEIAEAWAQQPPSESVELLVLLTGCEETGLLGAAAWLDAHRDDDPPLPTVAVNVDGIGFGPPRFLGAEVPAAGVALRIPAWLNAVCQRVATDLGLDAGPHALPGPTDTLAFLARGVPAVSIVGFRDGFRLPHYHTPRDTAANMDFAVAAGGRTFAAAVVRAVASQALSALENSRSTLGK